MLPPVIVARTRRRAVARTLAALACAALPLVAACGKKGPPLAPLIRLPVAPAQVSASRAGGIVTIGFTVPGANVSGVHPADIARVDVYAWTGPDVPAARMFKVAKVVASVPVRTPPPPPEPDKDGAVPPPPPPVGPGVDQGAVTELQETLAPDAFVAVELSDRDKTTTPLAHSPKLTPPDATPVPPPLTRRYVVVGVNRGGKRGPAAAQVAVPLWTPPPPPLGVSAKVLQTGAELTWTPPARLRGPVLANALPDAVPVPAAGRAAPRPRRPDDDEPSEDEDEPPAAGARPQDGERPPGDARTPGGAGERPQDAGQPQAPRGRPQGAPQPPEGAAGRPEGTAQVPATISERSAGDGKGPLPARLAVPSQGITTGYHVYDIVRAAPQAEPPGQAGGATPAIPRRLTTAPVKVTRFSDTRVEYGVERCYVVRTVETMGMLSVESEGSAPACVQATDVFPPASPKSLAAVASAGAISLIWEGSEDPDLAGYIVLRGTAPGTPAERLTPQPVRETTFRDTTVKPGTRYVYAVIAVDTAKPPNASAPSNRIEETAR